MSLCSRTLQRKLLNSWNSIFEAPPPTLEYTVHIREASKHNDEKPAGWREAWTPQPESSPWSLQLEKSSGSSEEPAEPKTKTLVTKFSEENKTQIEMFRIFPSGHWELGWRHIQGAWAALVPRLDGNGDKEAGKGVPANETPCTCLPDPLEMKPPYPDRLSLNFIESKLPAPPNCWTPEVWKVTQSSGGGVPTSPQLPPSPGTTSNSSRAGWGHRD